MMMKNKIYPCLWFDNQAKKAATYYTSIFKNSEILEHSPLVVTFVIDGQKFMALNAGPAFTPNPSISFNVVFEKPDELEYTWQILMAGGSVLMPLDKYDWSEKYGWIKDKFGISWQLSYGQIHVAGQKVTSVLIFANEQAGKAEEAIKFYTSVFDDSSVTGILKYGENESDLSTKIKHALFKLGGNAFMAMEISMPHAFSFNEGISFAVDCKTQKEIDYYWGKLSVVPEAEQCGWLKDKFGISRQIVPAILPKLLNDPEKSKRVTKAFLKMKKFEIEKLLNA